MNLKRKKAISYIGSWSLPFYLLHMSQVVAQTLRIHNIANGINIPIKLVSAANSKLYLETLDVSEQMHMLTQGYVINW